MLSPQGFVTQKVKDQKNDETQLLPHDLRTEEALLGSLLIDPAQFIEVGYLQPGDFFLLNHAHLYQVMHDLFNKNGDYDYITVIDRMTVLDYLDEFGGIGNIGELMNATPTSYGSPEYAKIIYDCSVRRQLIAKATGIVQTAHKKTADLEPGDLVSRSIESIADIDSTRNLTKGAKPISQAIQKLYDRFDIVMSGGPVGLKTNIKAVDFMLGGLMEKKIYILAGRPGMGKSGLALQLAHNMANEGKHILYFSLEMAEEDIAARLVSQICRIPYEAFNTGKIDDWSSIINATEQVEKLPITIDDTPALTIAAMKAVAQKQIIKHPVDLVIIDHAGIAQSSVKGKRYEQVSQIADDSMALPKQLGCPVLVLLQLSRSLESRQDKRPRMEDLRDTGKWEEDADSILFLYRDEVYNPDAEFNNLAEIIIGKNRGGKTGTAFVYHDKTTSRFTDLETRTVKI
jgi:replicative DNA helicase